MYVVVFFLLLWVLFQVILIDARCTVENPEPNRLYILETPNDYHKIRNKLFTDTLESRFSIFQPDRFNGHSQFYDISDYDRLENCSSSLVDIMKDARNLRYMIHLQVEDFYQNNYNNVIKLGYEWADDVDDCMLVNGKKRCIDNKDVGNNNDSHMTVSRTRVKLISTAVTLIPSLYDQTINFPNKFEPIPQRNPIHFTIIVCYNIYKWKLDSFTTVSYYDTLYIKITFKLDDDCNDSTTLDKDIIAILAPNPNYVKVTNKPVVFYEKPYVVPKATDLYDNSIMRMSSLKTLGRALQQLMKRKHWSRVAVLSDDSEKSYEFEQELRVLFNNEDISYVVMAVSGTNQGISEVLTTLKQYEARIIIANVDEQLADTLGYHAKEHDLTISHKVLWIAPGWSRHATKIAARNMGTVLSLLPKEPYLNKAAYITNYIKRIRQLIQDNQNHEYYDYLNTKVFTRDLRRYLNWTNDDIDVFQTKSDNSKSDRVATFINGKLNLSPFYAPKDRQEGCLLKSQNYYKPCDDMDLIYFMLVIMVFAVSILGITFFFQTHDTPYNRM